MQSIIRICQQSNGLLTQQDFHDYKGIGSRTSGRQYSGLDNHDQTLHRHPEEC